MKKFSFRLQTTLSHRETLENLREQEYLQAQSVLAAIERRILALETTIREMVTSRPGGAIGIRFDAPELYDRERYVETLQSALDALKHQADAARVVAEDARLRLVAARQGREAVSRLREKALTAHTVLQIKTEQDAMDEMATLRLVRADREEKREQREKENQAALREVPMLHVQSSAPGTSAISTPNYSIRNMERAA